MAQRKNICTIIIGILFIGFAFYSFPTFGSKPYKLTIHAPQLSKQKVQLSRCINGNLQAIDSLTLSSKGKGIFHLENTLQNGIYFFSSQSFTYDFLIGEETKGIFTIDTLSQIYFTEIKGNKEANKFNEYKKFLQKQKHKRENGVPQENLDQEVFKYTYRLIHTHPNTYLSDFLEMILLFSQHPIQEAFKYISLNNEALWHSTYLPKKIIQYLTTQHNNDYQKLIQTFQELAERTKKNTPSHSFLIEQFLTFSLNYPYVEGENLRAFLTEKYILPDTLSLWRDKFIVEYQNTLHCKLGQKAQNLQLRNINEDLFDLQTLSAPLRLLLFYDSECNHCRHLLPEYQQLYQKYHKEGLEIIAIYIGFDKEEWKQFIKEYNCTDWINAFIIEDSPNFWQYYDISYTPAIYLINQTGEIIAKKCTTNSLEKIIKKHIYKP